ncbi:MAG: hypothetical protein ACO1RT_09975 [Planctomycetaceae bacterium]
MSVRKLALAIASRVNGLRERFTAQPRLTLSALAMAAAATCGSGVWSPETCSAQVAPGHTPFQDPFAFDPNFRWFEPIYQADFDDMKPKKRANRGWFGTYDRLNLYMSRPEQEQGNTKLDSSWGDRYDVGFMLEEDNGWLMSYMGIDGPNQYDGFDRERLNRLNIDQLTGDADFPAQPFGLSYPASDRNNPGFNTRFVAVRNSENVVNFNNFELNKTWRLEPYHYGGMLEPMVGVRYMSFDDLYQRMDYDAGLFSDPSNALVPGAAEIVTTIQSQAENDMIGGQLGFRYFKFQDRFRYSAELRVFSMANFQCNRLQTTQETTYYGGTTVAVGDDVQGYFIDKTRPVYERNEEFAFGFDIRGEVSYQITRMIELRGGFQVIDIAQGLWRGRLGDPAVRTDQQALMAGATFGVALNR